MALAKEDLQSISCLIQPLRDDINDMKDDISGMKNDINGIKMILIS